MLVTSHRTYSTPEEEEDFSQAGQPHGAEGRGSSGNKVGSGGTGGQTHELEANSEEPQTPG